MKRSVPALVDFWRSPTLPMIEGRSVVDSPRGYRPHLHSTYSLGLIDSGESRVKIGRASVRVGAGDLVFIPENLVHSCNPVPGRLWSYRMLYLDPSWLRRKRLFARFGRRIPEGVGRAGPDTQAFDALETLLRAGEAGPESEKTLVRLLSLLFSRAPARGAAAGRTPESPSLEKVKTRLREKLFERVPLEELAKVAGMEKCRLVRSFKRYTGLTPHAYQIDLRISRAREMLRQGRGSAETAYALGFSDQSHFQRAFKPRVAATPGEFAGRKPGGRR